MILQCNIILVDHNSNTLCYTIYINCNEELKCKLVCQNMCDDIIMLTQQLSAYTDVLAIMINCILEMLNYLLN